MIPEIRVPVMDPSALGKKGFRGNGHFLMLEMNSLEIAAYVDRWISGKIQG